MKYFEHSFHVKTVCCDYSELDCSWGLNNTIAPFIRLYYIADGRGRVLHGKQNIVLERGKFYLLPSQSPLTFWTTGHLNVHWAHVELALAPGIDVFNLIPGKVMCLHEPEADIVERFKRLTRESSETLPGNLRSQALMMEIIAAFLQRYDIKLPSRLEKDLTRFEPVISLFEKLPVRRWEIRELARRCGLGRIRFSTEFKRVFSMAPSKFIMHKRLEHARYLLLNTDLTLDDIASELDFNDAFHFSKAFKSGAGLSPKKFRDRGAVIQP